jgi:hypothetical protein
MIEEELERERAGAAHTRRGMLMPEVGEALGPFDGSPGKRRRIRPGQVIRVHSVAGRR